MAGVGWLHRITFGAVTLVMVLAIADGLGAVDLIGVDQSIARARYGTGELEVEYPTVTRPALATPFRIRVVQPGGFDEPITVAISRPWIEMWDENGFYPSPSGETADGDWVEYEFDQPDGDELVIFYDARLEPARQDGERGAVELRDSDGKPLASVEFRTRVMP